MISKFVVTIAKIFRIASQVVSRPIIRLMRPLKLHAYQTRFPLLKRIILEFTTLFDFLMVFANVQNTAIDLNWKIYGGNFIFGKSIMVTQYPVAEQAIQVPTLRGNRFMGVDLVSNDPMVFVSNAGPINTSAPVRELSRDYIDAKVMTPVVRAMTVKSVTAECSEILDQWLCSKDMTSMWSVRGAVTRLYLKLLADITLPKSQTDAVTFNYARRFVEFSMFGRYCPLMLGLLGTREGIRKDAYVPLREFGIDNMVIDMTLFAAMFSVGTIVIKCLEFCRVFNIDYALLDDDQKVAFVIESQRLYPTVTTVHRILEQPETVEVAGQELKLQAGDELTYPFWCINRDPDRFVEPERFNLSRPAQELQAVLSWSVGRHVCPAKDLSIVSIVVLLDTLARRDDLRKITVEWNLEF